MTTRKNYNSVIFLTTLSVYLGLVLVGAPAPVLAQAALTSKLEVKDKIEKKDDLDKKPDENDLLAESILGIVNDLDKFSKSKEFSWEAKSSITIEDLNFCQSDNTPAYEGSYSTNISQKVGRTIDKRSIQIARNFNKLRFDYGLGDFYKGYPEGISFNLLTENKILTLQVKINTKDDVSQKFFSLVNASIPQKEFSAYDSKLSLINEKTKVTSENNQIFIVTRLPRGSLDALLVKDGAK